MKHTARGTELRDLRQSGSLKALFPRMAAGGKQSVLVNTAGGITGGDRFGVHATAEENTHLTLTTQAAERAYLAQPGEVGRLDTRLSIAARARLNWLPQETILFQGCNLRRSLRIEMAPDARFLMVEPLVFGRQAMAECLSSIAFSDRVEIRLGGTPLYLDAMTFKGDAAAHMRNWFVAAGAGALASLVYVSPDAEAHLPAIREMLPETAGASLIGKNLLLMRSLAADSFALRQTLVPVLTRLSGAELPRPWMI